MKEITPPNVITFLCIYYGLYRVLYRLAHLYRIQYRYFCFKQSVPQSVSKSTVVIRYVAFIKMNAHQDKSPILKSASSVEPPTFNIRFPDTIVRFCNFLRPSSNIYLRESRAIATHCVSMPGTARFLASWLLHTEKDIHKSKPVPVR